MDLNTPIQEVPMVGPVYARRLEKLGIKTVENLLSHFPTRYDDFSLISKIEKLEPGETVTIQGKILEAKNIYTKNNKKIQRAVVSDETDSIDCIWFNQPFLVRNFKIGETFNFSGKVDWFGRKISMISPEYEQVSGARYQLMGAIHTGRLIPIYPETYGLSSKWLRSRIAPILKNCIDQLLEYLPYSILDKNHLLDYKNAISNIHFPQNKDQIESARKRLIFNELFIIQLASLERKEQWKNETVGKKFQISNFKFQIQDFISKLPFKLTTAQDRAVTEILNDLSRNKPMNRLLEGDVGSGKTVVAAIAMYVSFLNGFQSIIMAPTEILAKQHFETLKNFLEPQGMNIGLITSQIRVTPTENQQANVLIGTHALLSDKNKELFKNVGLVVIDEQHRFGVEQRTKIKEKGINPHLLTMTATPIPRTVALTLYGDLDLSVLDEMPIGRQKVKTWVVPQEKRQAAYNWIKQQVKETLAQAFIICPLIEESETLTTIRAATKEFEYLRKEVFFDLKLGLLHGRLKSSEKDKVLNDFRSGKLDILVATAVVEVGIDIPNATIMMIEEAERFGLAELHQLRGRVGRGDKQSYCLLFSQSKDTKRLVALEKLYIGSQLAELDLKTRGAGEIYGTRQHGIPDLKIASLSDTASIEETKLAAQDLIKEDPFLKKFPLLKEKLNSYTIKEVNPD